MTTTPFNLLTPREIQVAKGLASGKSNGEIAAELGISIKTVDTHRAHVLKKLQLRNNVTLALAAVAAGFIEYEGVTIVRPNELPT